MNDLLLRRRHNYVLDPKGEDFIGFEAEKLKPLTVIQSRSSNPNENVNKLADVDIPKRQLTIDTLIAEPKIRSDQIEMDFFSQLV